VSQSGSATSDRTLQMKYLIHIVADSTCLIQLFENNSLRFQSTRLEHRKVPGPTSKLFAITKKYGEIGLGLCLFF